MTDKRKCNIPKEYCSIRDKEGYCSLSKGYECQPVVDRCKEDKGCERMENGYCKAYIFPASKWRPASKWGRGNCPLATHVKIELETKKQQMKRRVGQQKGRRLF